MSDILLTLENVTAQYNKTQVLFGINFSMAAGEILALVGRNGMGKSTTIRSILGLVETPLGKITFSDHETTHLKPAKIAQLGIGWVPEGRQITPNLTVYENLIATARTPSSSTSDHWDLQRVLDLFPRLKERIHQMGNALSGGEQQMLAIGRALMTNPRLLILDEATEGLSPLIREEIWRCLLRLKEDGLSILIVDKNVQVLAQICRRFLVMEKGEIVWQGLAGDFLADKAMQVRYLGV